MLHVRVEPSFEPLSVEYHARRLVREQFTQGNLPFVANATRALEPGWCYVCDERAWVKVGGYGKCSNCQALAERNNKPGF